VRNLFASLALALTLLVGVPCTQTGCGTLAPSGVYQGDKTLYDADFAIAGSYDLLHSFVTWEFKNREALTTMPAVKEYADKVRAGARQWVTSAIACRDAYAASPSAENRTNLQKAIAVLREAVVQGTKYQVSAAILEPPTTPTP